MRARSFTTPPVSQGSQPRAFWTGTSRRDTTGTSAAAWRHTSEPLASAVELPFRLDSEEGRSTRRVFCLALVFSLVLHSLVLALVQFRIHVDSVRRPLVPVTLLLEPEDAPSELA